MTIGDHEWQPGDEEEYDLDQEDAIGQEMADLRHAMREADVDGAWVPPPSGLEQTLGVGGGTNWPLYMIGTPGRDGGTLAGFCTYTDIHGREVLPLFSSVEGARGYVDSEAGFGDGLSTPVNCHDVGGLAVLVEVLLTVDLIVVDPDPVPHPGRCGFRKDRDRWRSREGERHSRWAEEREPEAKLWGDAESEYWDGFLDSRFGYDNDLNGKSEAYRAGARRALYEREQDEAEYERDMDAAYEEGKRDYWRYQRGLNGEPPREGDRISWAYNAGAEERPLPTLAPLGAQELAALERSLLKDGCQDPILKWDEFVLRVHLVDRHPRRRRFPRGDAEAPRGGRGVGGAVPV